MKTHTLFPHQRTVIYQEALELVRRVRGRIRHGELRDQAERASVSCLLAIGEGLPYSGEKMRRQYFERARASLCELVTATDGACSLEAMKEDDWEACQEIAWRVRGKLIGLLR